MASGRLTARQREVFRKVARAHRAGVWYRAEGHGERVTLASLYYRVLLKRRARRGVDGEANTAYEYKIGDLVAEHAGLPKETP